MATLKNVTQTLANARKLCPGMSNDFYLLTDYMSMNANDELDPPGIVLLALLVGDDLQKGRNGFAKCHDFPDNIRARAPFIMSEISIFPQFIDAIADDAFAAEVRSFWRSMFHTEPPKRVNTKVVTTDEKYPGYVTAAVDWWANAIISPKFDNGESSFNQLAFMLSGSTKQYTPEEIKTFKESLAKSIAIRIEERGRCHIDVDYNAYDILKDAGDLIGVNPSFGYPCKTHMTITPEKVDVSAGYGAPWKTIWEA